MPNSTNNTQQRRRSGWSWSLLMFSLVLFAAAVVSYLSIIFGYIPFLNQRLNSLDQKIQEVNRTISQEDQEQLAEFYSQLINAKGLLRQHVSSSKIFSILERNTNQNVSFSAFDLDIAQEKLELSGIARTYEDAIRQSEAFRRMPELKSFTITGMQVGRDGGVQFGTTLEFVKSTLLVQ